MSMEILTLSDRRAASVDAWQQCIDDAGIALHLPKETSIVALHGFLPAQTENGISGFECDHCDPSEIFGLYKRVSFSRHWKYALAFNWHGFDDGLAAYQAAAAYANATDGVVFDPQESLIMSPQEAFAAAAQFKADIPRMREALQVMMTKRRNP